ncbi:MAG: PAS domain S-box protein [Pseudomonadota bacterium]
MVRANRAVACRYRRRVLAGLLQATLLCLMGLAAPSPVVALATLPSVVILDSYHQGEAWSDNELAGILPALREVYPDLVPAIERLDAKRYPGVENLRRASRFLAEKYRDRRVDLLMVLDNAALSLVVENPGGLFPGVPVVFAGINGFRPGMLAGRDKVTGVKETEDLAGTLRLILSLQPGVKQVLAVHDHTNSGLLMRREMDETLPAFQDRLRFSFSPDASFAQLKAQLASLPADSAVLILTYVTDQDGRTFTRAESTRLISQASPVPVYAMHETRLRHGILGGMLLEGRAHGRQAAALALEILAGKEPSQLPVVDSHSRAVFDYQQMARFNIPLEALPPGSRVINRPVTPWQRHQAVLTPLLLVLALLGATAALLGWALLRGRRAETALRQSEARHRLLLETMTLGVAECEASGRITYVNPAFGQMQASSLGELLGTHLWETLAPGPDRDGLPAYFQELLREQPEAMPYFTTNQRRDGSHYLARVDWSYQRDPQALVHGFTLIIQDITEQIKAQQALLKSEEKFRQLFEHSNDAIFVHDDRGNFLDINERACQLLGHPRQRVLALKTVDCHPPEARSGAKRAFRELLAHGRASFETVFRRADGSLIDVEISVSPVGGQERVFQAIARDITERKRAEADRARLESQLRQSQKMEAIGTLAGGIAHDFNNILGAILGFAELAREDALAGETKPQDIAHIIQAAERARDLVQHILTFSRKMEPQRRPMDINQEVRRAMDLLQSTLPKMISMDLRLAPDLRRVNADPGQMSQVVMNLAANAFHAMPEGGRLTIITANLPLDQRTCPTCGKTFSGDWVMLSVTDTGQGIAPENLPRIFDPFFTTKEVGQGTGLGLSTVHGIITGHDGHIECMSTPGQGATFRLYLPALAIASPLIEAEGQPLEAPDGQGTILLVDDEEALLVMGQRLLGSAGYRVLTAHSGEEALATYRQAGQEIALVIMDLGMPGIGGHKALKEILAHDPLARIVIASGYAAQEQVKAALQAGAAGYVAKPYHRAALLSAIKAVLDDAGPPPDQPSR